MTSNSAAIGPYDVLIVPFPFAERNTVKRRPALALSSAKFVAETGTVVVAMITTSAHDPWPHDVPLRDIEVAGVRTPCVVRWKLATRDVRMVVGTAGSLSPRDRAAVRKAMRQVLV